MYLLALLRLSLRKIRKKGKEEEKMVAIAGNGVAASGGRSRCGGCGGCWFHKLSIEREPGWVGRGFQSPWRPNLRPAT